MRDTDAGATAAPERPPATDRLAELRALVLGPFRTQLQRLQRRLDDPVEQAKDVSRALPTAISEANRRDSRLSQALAPLMQDAIRSAVRRNPQPLADALFPILGPAIRRAIAAAMEGLVQSLNRTLEHTVSFRGLRWRWESLRTGVPFAEVVLRHSLVYRVEQLLLIHRETGLLLQHVATPSVAQDSPDMVAGMLTAIQDFARDSFRADGGDTLETLRVGELTVWVEAGSEAVLAAVIRGHAPGEVRAELQSVLENIQLEFGDDLEQFQGDAEHFGATRPALESLLKTEVDERRRRRLWPAALVGATLLGLLIWWQVPRIREQRRWDAYVAELRGTPGLMMVEAGRREGRRFIEGLRDPLAADPVQLLAAAGFDSTQVTSRWAPFMALEPTLALRRATDLLAPPATVRLELNAGVLSAVGAATHEWIDDAARFTRALAGVARFSADSVRDLGPRGARRSVEQIEALRILFASGSDVLSPEAEALVQQQAERIRLVDGMARLEGITLTLRLVGSTDGVGTSETNATLSRARAERVRAALAAYGTGAATLTTEGQPSPTAPALPEFRRVTFEVSFSPLP